jgi:formate-dependent nitrite reductase membrane component NrfD
MNRYEWMVKYTPQTEWIAGRGILLWLAFFFIELGAGMFLVSSIFADVTCALIGWLICAVLGGGLHFLYLGHPFRFYRMFFRFRTSWISRGLLFVSGFLFLGAIHMALAVVGKSALVLLIVTDALAFLTIIYGGFAMSCINSIPLWNTALLPLLYVVAGLWGGAALSMAVILQTSASPEVSLHIEEFIRTLMVAFLVILPTYLISARYGLSAGKVSVREIVMGRWWPLFWIVVVCLGILLPLGVVINSLVVGLDATSALLLNGAIAFELIGDLALRYLILKNGHYNPLVPSPHAFEKMRKRT